MGTAAKQLEQLNEEIAALNLEVKAAFKAYESAATTTARTAIDLVGAPEDKRFQMIHDGAQKGEHRALGNYEDLKKDKERLLEDRRALHAKLPSAGAGLTAAAALPAEQELQDFWCQLAAVQQLSKIDSAQFLQLGSGACFPIEGNTFQGRLIVRRCYHDLVQQLEHHFSCSGHTFIVTGNPGIGKSLFMYFLMWHLARSGKTVVWDRRDNTPLMFSSHGVVEGPLKAFRSQLKDPETWYLVDGKPPANRRAKTVLVTSPDWDVWKEAIKRPNSMVRYMPVWTWEEIQAARQLIFSDQHETDVVSRFSRWGGIPRFVLQKTDAADQALLEDAMYKCSLHELASSMTDPSSASRVSHRFLHLTVDAGYLKGPVVLASKWVEEEIISRYSRGKQHEVHDFLTASGGRPSVAAFRGALWERYAHVALQRGGSFSCRDLQKPGAGPFEIEFQPCSTSVGLWDVQDISTGLSIGVYGWGRNKNLPSVDAVIQPNKLFQITVSGDHRVHAGGLANAVRAMQAEEQNVQLFFVVPPDVFSKYSKQTLKRIRGDLTAENVARGVKQFVLKIDL